MTYQQQHASDAAAVSGFAQRFVQQGESALLTRQLRKRFGALDDATLARLREASAEQLERWGEQFVEAQTLDDVFRDADV